MTESAVPNPYLQVRAIRKSFGATVALDAVSLDVAPGEFVFLLGPSGCGKTTLLRIIAGLEEADGGQVIQAGRDVTHLSPAQRDFGIVFQSYALFPNMTVAQNIAYGLHSRRMTRSQIAARVDELLALVGMPDLHKRFPAQLSGGQQQRVALARALAISPGMLLLDEPLSALDARVRASLRLEIAALQQRLHLTTIMVTHDQEEALTMADRIVVMDRGRIVQVDAPPAIYNRPTTPFVADFVGQMNFLPGTVHGNGNGNGYNAVNVGGTLFEVSGWERPTRDGGAVRVAIRPEEVEIVRDAIDQTAPNTLTVRVQAVEFLGPFYRVHMFSVEKAEANAAAPMRLTLQVGQGEMALSDLQAGAALRLRLPPAALRVYPANGTVQP